MYSAKKTLGPLSNPKGRPAVNQIKGIVDKIKGKTCDFSYVKESKRSWNSSGVEHKPGTRSNNKIAETTPKQQITTFIQTTSKFWRGI